MGYFDNAILITAYKRKKEELNANKKGIYGEFFKEENLEKAYGYKALKDFFSSINNSTEERQKYSSFYNMHIETRNRLLYFLLLAEIDANQNITIEQLMDNTSIEGIQRKQAAADKVKEWFNNEITSTEDFSKLLVDNGKKFKTLFNSVAGNDFSDEKATIAKMETLGLLASVHFDGVFQLGTVGVEDKDMLDDAKTVLLFPATEQRNEMMKDINALDITNGDTINRKTTLTRMCTMSMPHKAVTILNDKAKLDAISKPAEVIGVTSSVEYIPDEIKDARTGIYGKLTDDELAKLAFVPSLSEKLTMDYTINGDANDEIKIIFDGITIYDHQDKNVLADNDENVNKIKNIIREEYNKYHDKEFDSAIGADCFGDEEAVKWLVNDIKAAGAKLVADLANNTRFGHSSGYYRDMQKAAKNFNKALRNIDAEKFNDEEGRRQIKEQLKALTATMEGYLAHKDLDNVQYTDAYVLGRINLAKSSLETFNRFHKYCESADRFHTRQAMWHKTDRDILDKYDAMREANAASSEDNKSKALKENFINDEKMAAYEINRLANSKNNLTAEEKKSVVDNFEKMCALRIVSELCTIKEFAEKKIYGSVNDEKLLERIRETRKFKELFADLDKIDGDLARKIISDGLEDDVRKEFKRRIAKEIIDQEAKNENKPGVNVAVKPLVDPAYKEYKAVVDATAMYISGLIHNYDKEEIFATYIAEHILMDKIIERDSLDDKLAPVNERREKAVDMVKQAVEYKDEIRNSQAYKGVIEVYRVPESSDPEEMYQLYLKLDKNPLDAEKIIKEEYERLNPGEEYVPLADEIRADEEYNNSFNESMIKDEYDPVGIAEKIF